MILMNSSHVFNVFNVMICMLLEINNFVTYMIITGNLPLNN